MNSTYASSSKAIKHTWFNILSITISCIVLIQLVFAYQFVESVSLYNNFDFNLSAAFYSLMVTLALFGLLTIVATFFVRNYLKQIRK